ncbi:MAG: hypothetical protein ACKO2L_01020 [Planctomycetaceae bacterium]
MKHLLTFAGIVILAGLLSASVPHSSQASPWLRAVPEDGPKAVEDSMHEFMEYVFQPAYLRLKQSMATAPADNKGWKAIKSDSLILAESCNLLFDRAPDEKAADWKAHAVAAREKGGQLYSAAKAKDFAAAGTAWKTMLESCNACHRQFENGKHILQP